MTIHLNVTLSDGSKGFVESDDPESILITYEWRKDIVEIDLSPLASNATLRTFMLTEKDLQSIDLSPLSTCKNLEWVALYGNHLQNIDLSPLHKCKNLRKLDLGRNRFKEIDLTPLKSKKKLDEVDLKGNSLKNIDLSPLSSCTKLELLNLNDNQLRSVDLSPLSKCINLVFIWLKNNQLNSIDLSPLSACSNLVGIALAGNKLKSIDLSPLSTCTKFDGPSLGSNQLKSIDLTPLRSCINISGIYLNENRLRAIDLSPLSSSIRLGKIDLNQNELKTVDLSPLSSCPDFASIHLMENALESLDITPLILSPIFNGVEIDSPVSSWIRDPYQRNRLVKRSASWPVPPERIIIEPPAPEGSWELLHKLASIPHGLSIPIQTYILKSLGLERYGLIDADISDFLCSIPPEISLDEARERTKPFLIERVCEQIDRGGTTIGLDVDEVFTEARGIAARLQTIAKLRDSEMKQVMAIKKQESIIRWTYDVQRLYLTAYGFSIITKAGLRAIHEISSEDFEYIQDVLSSMGYEMKVSSKEDITEQPPVENMSVHMKHYVSRLHYWNYREMKRQDSSEARQLIHALVKTLKKNDLCAILQKHNIPFKGSWIKHTLAETIIQRMGAPFVRAILEEAK
ncbi:MAG: leucine-rich repeat domain-containing protein [Candidatus Thorarchaeota archaeon]